MGAAIPIDWNLAQQPQSLDFVPSALEGAQAGQQLRGISALQGIDINDPDAVFAEFPAFKKENFLKPAEVDKAKLRSAIRPIVNALYDAGTQVPGCKAYYASESEPADTGSTHNQLA